MAAASSSYSSNAAASSSRQPLPPGWLSCPKVAAMLIPNTSFLLCKTPISNYSAYDSSSIDRRNEFVPSALVQYCQLQALPPLSLVIDLTAADTSYYLASDFESQEVNYVHLPTRIASNSTTAEVDKTLLDITNVAVRIIRSFLSKHQPTTTDASANNKPAHTIAIHDTYGFNIAGAVAVSYLVEEYDLPLSLALSNVAKVRPPGVYDKRVLLSLYGRYGSMDDTAGGKISLNVTPPKWDVAAVKGTKAVKRAASAVSAATTKPNTMSGIASTVSSNGGSTDMKTSSNTGKSEDHVAKRAKLDDAKQMDDAKAAVPQPAATAAKQISSAANASADSALVQHHGYLRPIDATITATVLDELNRLLQSGSKLTLDALLQQKPVTKQLLARIAASVQDYITSWRVSGSGVTAVLFIDSKAASYFLTDSATAYQAPNFSFHQPAAPTTALTNTVALCELVVDTDRKTQQQTPRLLVTDLVVYAGEVLAAKQGLKDRVAAAESKLVACRVSDSTDGTASCLLRVRCKMTFPLSSVDKPLKMLKTLPHAADGVTITCTKPIGQDATYEQYEWTEEKAGDVSKADLIAACKR